MWLNTKRLAYHERLCVFPCTTHNTVLSEHMDEMAPRLGESFGSQRQKPINLGKPISSQTQEKRLLHERIAEIFRMQAFECVPLKQNRKGGPV